jgi:hypothetical protein
MPEPRTHIQFSGSLKTVDAEQIVRMLKEAIKRRPKECGAMLRVHELGVDDAEDYCESYPPEPKGEEDAGRQTVSEST